MEGASTGTGAAQVPPKAEPEVKPAGTLVEPAKPAEPQKAGEPKAEGEKPAAEGAAAKTGAEPEKAGEPAKGGEAKPAAKEGEKPAGEKAVVSKDDLKIPEGSLLDPKAAEDVAAFAQAKGLSKEAAQAVLERESKALGSFVETEKQKLAQSQETWAKECSLDKEFGGEAFDKNIELGHRVIKRFGNPVFEKILKDTGAAIHPEVVRVFVRIGQAMSEDQLVLPGSAASASERMEDRLYSKPAPAAEQ